MPSFFANHVCVVEECVCRVGSDEDVSQAVRGSLDGLLDAVGRVDDVSCVFFIQIQ